MPGVVRVLRVEFLESDLPTEVIVPGHTIGIPTDRFQERGVQFEEIYAVSNDGFATANPGLVKDVHEAFLRSRDLCLAELDEVAAAAARWEPFDSPTLAGYFRTLDFSLGARQVAGLREFANRAAALGEVPPLPPDGPEFFSA